MPTFAANLSMLYTEYPSIKRFAAAAAQSIADRSLKSGQSLVLINRDEDRPGALKINLNDTDAARRGFISLLWAGYRRFAFANSAATTPSLTAREDGLVAAGLEHGIDVMVERHGSTWQHRRA